MFLDFSIAALANPAGPAPKMIAVFKLHALPEDIGLTLRAINVSPIALTEPADNSLWNYFRSTEPIYTSRSATCSRVSISPICGIPECTGE